MRLALIAFVSGVGVGSLAFTQPQPAKPTAPAKAAGPVARVVSAVDIDEEIGGQKARVTTFELTFAPGAAGTPHRHPGPIFGYVVAGEFEQALGNEKPRRLKAGDSFYEPAMALHAVSRNPSTTSTTRVIAILVHPRDAKALSTPEPAAPVR